MCKFNPSDTIYAILPTSQQIFNSRFLNYKTNILANYLISIWIGCKQTAKFAVG